jgi:hypothetical protein
MLHDPRQLLEDFNGYRAKTYNVKRIASTPKGHFAARALRATEKRLETMAAMQAWCEGHGIDARQWLYFLFNDVRKWMYAPDIKQLSHLTGEKYVERFKAAAVPLHYTTKMQAEAAERDAVYQRVRNPMTDLMQTAENVCLSLLRDTYGYHPKSKHCPTCPQAEACKAATCAAWQTDVVAMRAR